MHKSLIFKIAVFVVIVAVVWYLSIWQSVDVVLQAPVPQDATEVPAQYVYKDDVFGFSLVFPTALSSTTNDALYRVEPSYVYSAKGPNKSIPGVQFIIPRAMTIGTNLSTDSYLSVEQLAKGQVCDAVAFMGVPNVQSYTIREGTVTYSFASSTGAAAGNRYEEYIYAVPDSNPCTAVRYFVHYGAIENYDSSTINAFNRAKLFADFDAIRKTLIIKQ